MVGSNRVSGKTQQEKAHGRECLHLALRGNKLNWQKDPSFVDRYMAWKMPYRLLAIIDSY
jgi:hypothetical protein